jgi:hypothetical protein
MGWNAKELQLLSGNVTAAVLGRFALVQNKFVLHGCRNLDVRIIGSSRQVTSIITTCICFRHGAWKPTITTQFIHQEQGGGHVMVHGIMLYLEEG